MVSPLISRSVSGIRGSFAVPGDKSISHRALILASQAVGATKITGLLEGEDVLHTAEVLQQMGIGIEKQEGCWVVKGVGTGGLAAPEGPLYMGNSGTGVRLMMGLVGSHPFEATFIGDESLSKRPMKRVITPLGQMSIEIEAQEGGRLPLTVKGNHDLVPITYELPVASAQVKSAILLAALNVPGKTTVIEPEATRDHTELMLRYLGAEVEVQEVEGKKHITLTGQPELTAKDFDVPADPSSAAFFVVAALITPESDITLKNVCINPLRIGLYTTLLEMGAKIEFLNERNVGGEAVADIHVVSSELEGIEVPAERAPSMIDEYPILSVAAAVAKGKTTMHGLKELRVKESDRLAAITDGLEQSGVEVEAGEDYLEVIGGAVKGGATITTHMDHRIAMAFLVLGMVAEEPITVDDGSMIATSFPNFQERMNEVGGEIN